MTRTKQKNKRRNNKKVRKGKRKKSSKTASKTKSKDKREIRSPDTTRIIKSNWFYTVRNRYVLQIFRYSAVTLFLSIVLSAAVGVSFACGMIAGAQIHNIYTATPIGRMQVISGLTGVGIAIVLLKFIPL